MKIKGYKNEKIFFGLGSITQALKKSCKEYIQSLQGCYGSKQLVFGSKVLKK